MTIESLTCSIGTNETDEEHKRIIDDYEYESLVYELLKDIELNEKQYKRLNEELSLIRTSRSFKTLYIYYLLVSKIKIDKRNYCLANYVNNLLIVYLLGISKVNPFDRQFLYDLPYEPVLGIPDDTRRITIHIEVSTSYRQILLDYLHTIIEDAYIIEKKLNYYKDKIWVSKYAYILYPKGEDAAKYGVYYNNGTIKGFKEIYKNNNHDMIVITIRENDRMRILDEGSVYLDDYNPTKAFDLLLDSCLANRNDHFVNVCGEPYPYYGLTFWDFCLSVCVPHNSTRNTLGTMLLKCREDVWKMLERCDFDVAERYRLFKEICKGKGTVDDNISETIKYTYPFDNEVLLSDILQFVYIYSLGASIEDVYNETKIAWIRKSEKSKQEKQQDQR